MRARDFNGQCREEQTTTINNKQAQSQLTHESAFLVHRSGNEAAPADVAVNPDSDVVGRPSEDEATLSRPYIALEPFVLAAGLVVGRRPSRSQAPVGKERKKERRTSPVSTERRPADERKKKVKEEVRACLFCRIHGPF